MDWVWRFSPHSGSALLVLLALADCAHDDGTNAYPSVATLATKCRLKERQIQHILHDVLEATTAIICTNPDVGRGKSLNYSVIMDEKRVQSSAPFMTERVHSSAQKGAAASAPEPSLTVIRPRPLFSGRRRGRGLLGGNHDSKSS